MKAAPFAYERPATLEAAAALMAEAKGEAKIMAGGQSLGPMLNLRLVQPALIIDITGLAELKQADRNGDELRHLSLCNLLRCGPRIPALAIHSSDYQL